jgi:hypothetical protein
MKLDLTEAIDIARAKLAREAWKLELTIGGQTYSVREVTRPELVKLAELDGTAEARPFLKTFFQEPEPDVMSWDRQTLSAVVAAVGHAVQARGDRLSEIAAGVVRRQIDAQSKAER